MSRETVIEAARAFWSGKEWRHPKGLPVYVKHDYYINGKGMLLNVYDEDEIAYLPDNRPVLRIWLEIAKWPWPRTRYMRVMARYLDAVLKLGAEKYPGLRGYKIIVSPDPLYRERLILVRGPRAWSPFTARIPLNGGQPDFPGGERQARILLFREPLPQEPGVHETPAGIVLVSKCGDGRKIALVVTGDGELYSCKPLNPARRVCTRQEWIFAEHFVRYACPGADGEILAVLEMLSP